LLLKTEKIFEKYPAKHPYLALIRFALGDSYFYLGEIDKAIRETEFALESLHEGFAVTRFLKLNLIFYYLYIDEYGKAEDIFESERVQDIGENLYLQYFWIYLLQMLIAYRNGNTRRAEYYCKRLMEKENSHILKTDYPFSYIALGEINIFINNYDAAEKYLNLILVDTMESENPYLYATAFSLIAYLYHLKNNSELASQNFIKMEKILQEHQYRNLDICNPELLKKIAEVSGFKIFETFTRLKVISGELNLLEKREKYELEFKTLGVFRVFIKGKEIEQAALIRQKRVADLLKLLIVFRENGISKEIVYETFWARYSYKSARDNLNTVVYRLRKIFGEENDFISTDANIIKLKDGSSIIDVDLFKQYIANGLELEKKKDIEAALIYYIKAETLYEGDFLEPGLYLDFIRDERENLKNKYKQLLFTMIKLSLDIKQFKESMAWANKLIGFDSLCEPAYRLLMISSVFTGNGSEISRIYHKLNKSLMENYNISPDSKTEKLKNILLGKTIPTSESWRLETII
jgi:DNA-binding SARP family transcriptional activator